MTEQGQQPIVFRCPSTDIDVINPMRVDAAWPLWLSGRPVTVSCFCGASHDVLMRRFVSNRSAVRRAVEPSSVSALRNAT